MTKWIEYTPGDKLPEGRVRIKCGNGWESETYSYPHNWEGWVNGHITHYMPEHKPANTYLTILEAMVGPEACDLARKIEKALEQ